MVTDIKIRARKYFDWELPIILFVFTEKDGIYEKKPIVKWQRFQTEKQTSKEFEDLPWDEAQGFAVLLGELKEGNYLCAIELDTKKLSDEVVALGRRVFDALPDSYTEETINNGVRKFYLASEKPKTDESLHNTCGISVLGVNRLCIMWPSFKYKRVAGSKIIQIENANQLMKEAVENCGIEVEKKHWFDRPKFSKESYRGTDPPCIKLLSRGTSEGLRNKYLLRYEAYLLNCLQLGVDQARRKIGSFNNRCIPPFKKDELNKRFAYIAQKEYRYGCDDEILKSLCDPDRKCPLRKKVVEEKETTPKFSSDVESEFKEELERVLNSDNQLEALTPHLDNVVVGEHKNKHVVFILLTGGKSSDPKDKTIVILKGTEGGGKSLLASETTRGYNVKEVGRFTEHALDYADFSDVEVLYIKELGKMDDEKYGVSTLKFVSGDDEGYTVEYTIRDEETGRFRTERNPVPCLTVISTTTRLNLDRQLERRAWLISIDESEELTVKVLKVKAERVRQESEKNLGLRKTTDYEFSREVIKRFIEQMEPKKIIIPFPDILSNIYSPKFLRLRGDIDKLYTFIKLYARFNLKRLWKLNRDTFAVTSEVTIEALELVQDIVTGMLIGVESRTEKLVKTLIEMQKEFKRTLVDSPTCEGSTISKAARDRLSVRMGKSGYTVRKYLNALEARGYLSSDGKRPKTYTLLYDAEEILKKIRGESVLLKSPLILKGKMDKEASEWLRSISKVLSLESIDIERVFPRAEESSLSIPSKKKIVDTNLAVKQTDSAKRTQKEGENEESNVISTIKCDACSRVIEGEPEHIDNYTICSECGHDYTIRGYREDDIIRELKWRKSYGKTEKEEIGDEEFSKWVGRVG